VADPRQSGSQTVRPRPAAVRVTVVGRAPTAAQCLMLYFHACMTGSKHPQAVMQRVTLPSAHQSSTKMRRYLLTFIAVMFLRSLQLSSAMTAVHQVQAVNSGSIGRLRGNPTTNRASAGNEPWRNVISSDDVGGASPSSQARLPFEVLADAFMDILRIPINTSTSNKMTSIPRIMYQTINNRSQVRIGGRTCLQAVVVHTAMASFDPSLL